MALWLEWLKNIFDSLLASLGFVNKQATVILVGLDNAGKTTLLNRLAKGTFVAFAPTEKPNHNEFKAGSVTFRAWDLGGHEAVRQLWDDFLPTTDAVVFLVDSADPDRLARLLVQPNFGRFQRLVFCGVRRPVVFPTAFFCGFDAKTAEVVVGLF